MPQDRASRHWRLWTSCLVRRIIYLYVFVRERDLRRGQKRILILAQSDALSFVVFWSGWKETMLTRWLQLRMKRGEDVSW